MLQMLTVLLSLAFATTPMDIPRQYVQQNQHNTFFLFNINGESLTANCYLTQPIDYSHCYFDFEDENNKKTVYETPFMNLYNIQNALLVDLKKLQAEWLKNYPLDSWGATFSLFRENNHEALAQLIHEIETESLPHRMFIPHHNSQYRKDTPYFYDSELTLRVWDIFKKHLQFRYKQ